MLLFKNVKFLSPDTKVLESGDVLIAEDKIADTGFGLEVNDSNLSVIEGDYILLPGMINAHLHPSKEVYGDILDSSPIDIVLDKVHSNNELEDAQGQFISSLKCLATAVRKGVTTLGLFTSRIESDYRAAQAISARCVINFCQSNQWVGSGKSPQSKTTDTILSEYLSAENAYQNKLVTLTPATASELSATDELLTGLHDVAVRYSKPFTLHVHEGSHQVKCHKDAYSQSGIKRMYELGVIDNSTTLIHASHLDETDCEIIKKSGCKIVHCPVSNSFVGAGTMPLAEFQSTNAVGLGTDAAMVNPVNDLTFDALFTLYHHGDNDLLNKVNAEKTFDMMTIGGAEALGLEKIGRIQSGYKADIIIYREKDIDAGYINTPVSILRMMHKEKPSDVIIDGRFIVKNNDFVNLDIRKISDSYSLLRRKITL
ncbi:amidohydrolase family protein [Pantoea vagans]|uniref:amidohydrolase family protein n=1 Tax=Pantoea vagans TaxID=470934 RepID=UPI0030160267